MGLPDLNDPAGEKSPPAFSIEPVQPGQISEIVHLHLTTLGYSLNSRLGPEHLHYLYTRLALHPGSMLAAAQVNGAVAGVISATLDLEALTDWIYADLNAVNWAIFALKILRQPAAWLQTWEAAWAPHTIQWQGETVRPCLTAIAVAPEARQLGVGRALVKAVDNFLCQNHRETYWLETLTTNKVAQAFYARLGFTIVHQHGTTLYLARRLPDPDGRPEF